MKFQIVSIFAAALLAGTVTAHSWLDCVETNVQNYAQAKADPNVDPSKDCKSYPRNKIYDKDWIKESTYYLWDLNGAENTDGLACRPLQGTPTYPDSAPMATVTPGQQLRARHWGNGHTRWDIGSPNHRDPGLVRMYWGGAPEVELKYKSDLTQKNWLRGAQANFSADTVTLITGNTMAEKANYFNFEIPQDIQNGRHMMVWVWAWSQGLEVNDADFNPNEDYDKSWMNSYSTCFDVMVTGSDSTGPSYPTPAPDGADEEVEPNSACATGTCLRGGMEAYPCTGADCPPCWYKSASGTIGCYGYGDNGKCPFGGAYDCKLNQQTRRALKHEREPFY